jgi:hypothetical protein
MLGVLSLAGADGDGFSNVGAFGAKRTLDNVGAVALFDGLLHGSVLENEAADASQDHDANGVLDPEVRAVGVEKLLSDKEGQPQGAGKENNA